MTPAEFKQILDTPVGGTSVLILAVLLIGGIVKTIAYFVTRSR